MGINYQLVAQVDAEDESVVQEIKIHSRGLQRVGNTWESIWIIDNQTTLVPLKGTFEFDILHRFGTIKNGYDDLWGLYAPSNIRIGFGYTPIDNLMIGVGLTKERMLWDFNAKYAILRERDQFPVSVTYYTNLAVDTRKNSTFKETSDRFSYFHQLMVARKVTRDFSVQGSISFAHFNSVEGVTNTAGNKISKLDNDHYSFALLGRYKISDAFAFIANYDQPITIHPGISVKPNISGGIEIATPLHAFQLFMGNYRWMVPQYNNIYNYNDYLKSEFLIGFNITRLIDLEEEDMFEMIFKRKKKK